jgi:hypothetical protein
MVLLAGVLAITVVVHRDRTRVSPVAPPPPDKVVLSLTPPGPTPLREGATPDVLLVNFSGSAAPLSAVGKVVSSGVKLTPSLAGTWAWRNDRTLVFTPASDWPVGQEVGVEVEPTALASHVQVVSYTASFRTAPFTASVRQAEFYVDPEDPLIKKVVLTLSFSHPVEPKSLEQRIKFTLGTQGRSFTHTVSYDKARGEAYVHSAVIPIPDVESSMTYRVEPGVTSSRGGALAQGLSGFVRVPGMGTYFRVESVQATLVRNDKFEPEQVLVMQFSDGVSEKEMGGHIEAWVLPRDKPAAAGGKAQPHYSWYNTAEVGPEVLKLSKPVPLTQVPTEQVYAKVQSFKYSATVGKRVYVRITRGLRSYGHYVLAKEFDTIFTVPEFPREVQLMHDGAVLSLAGERTLSVLSRGVAGLVFDIAKVRSSQVNYLVTQTSGRFTEPTFSYQFTEDDIAERFQEKRRIQETDPGKTSYSSLDLTRLLQSDGAVRHGIFVVSVTEDPSLPRLGTDTPAPPPAPPPEPAEESGDNEEPSDEGGGGGDEGEGYEGEGYDEDSGHAMRSRTHDRRLVLVTDLGLVVKDNADGSHDVFVLSINKGEPVSGATVKVLGRNGIPVLTRTTSADGRATFPSFGGLVREKAPVAWLVTQGNDLTFLPTQRAGDRQLDYSRFDVGGVVRATARGALDAFLFSDRGIYRPGDTVHLGAIVRPSDWSRSLKGLPLEVVVNDPRGMVVLRHKFALGETGLAEVSFKTEESAPTGAYPVALYLVKDDREDRMLGTTSVRVEEFLPDRLKISARFSTQRLEGWVKTAGLKGAVNLQNLFGQPAAGHRVSASISLTPTSPSFRKFAAYSFLDPAYARNAHTDRLADVETDENGDVELELGLERFDAATYRLTFTAEGFELEGGRSVTSVATVTVSPREFLVGHKADGELGFVSKGSTRQVEFIAVDSEPKQVGVKDLRTELSQEQFVSVLTRQPNGTYRYQSVHRQVPLREEPLAIPDQGVKLNLDTTKPGDFVLKVLDKEGRELSRVRYTVVGEANLTRNVERNAELQVRLPRTDYAPGEEVELQVNAPYTGAGLITIERDRVYSHAFFRTSTTSSVQRIRVPDDLEANGYVNVAFVRSLDSPEIFMSPLSYAVVPFSISRDKRTIKVELETAAVARPGEPFPISYKTSVPSQVLLFAVDEGILQVAGYSTPDPLSHFFRKRALEVRTAQLLDLILPEYSRIQERFSTGGDGEGAVGQNLNPFKRRRDPPVAFWSGLVQADGTARQVTYDVPGHFNGTLRVMAVAVSPGAVGVQERKALVRGPIILSPNVPTFLAPGDETVVSVPVANNVEGSGKQAEIKVELKVSEHLALLDGGSRSVTVDEGREAAVQFRVKANDVPGSGNLTFTASHKGQSVRFLVDTSVRPAAPYITFLQAGSLKARAAEVDVSRRMYPHYRRLVATASPLPLALAHGLLHFLRSQPYGCTEQLVSQAFPALVLRSRPDFGLAPEAVRSNLDDVLRVLRQRQNQDGAFGMWAANSHADTFQAAYAMHFLTEAKERGEPVPHDLMQRGLTFLASVARGRPDTFPSARERAYAAYVLTRNGQVTSAALTSLREGLKGRYAQGWKKDLTGLLVAASHKMLKQDKEALDILKDARVGDPQVADYRYFYDGQVRDALYLYLMSRHFPESLTYVQPEHLEAFASRLGQSGYNTLSASLSILGLDAYAAAVGEQATAAVTVEQRGAGKDKPWQPLKVPAGLFPQVDFPESAHALRVGSGQGVAVFYQVTQGGFDTQPPDKTIQNGIEVERLLTDESGKSVSRVELGGTVTVRLRARSVDKGGHWNVAFIDLLPGGFEPVMERGQPSSGSDGEEGGGEGEASPSFLHRVGLPDSTLVPDYVDVREDRLLVYGSAGSTQTEFSYRIKAVNRGSYQVPPLFAESMYQKSTQARSLSSRIVVE